jgi:hypothetical protein
MFSLSDELALHIVIGLGEGNMYSPMFIPLCSLGYHKIGKHQFRVTLVSDRANDEILQLAEQGNLQALSVYLNRHLIPNGAHVKVKQKEDSLHVLIVVMRESENQELLNSVQGLLTRLHPIHINRVKLYTQILGQKQSSLQQQFSLSAIAEQKVDALNRFPQQLSSPSSNDRFVAAAGGNAPGFKPTPSQAPSNNPSLQRYSVAEFLSQATSIDELKVLHNHPFFTGSCPKCLHQFQDASAPPIYWDCPECGWKDDLSTVIPPEKLQANSAQPSLTESKRLGDYLVEAGLLSNSQIEVALADQVSSNLKFGDVLVRRGWIKEETIEYLMQKIILPERAGLHHNAGAYLDSSRNLLKALFQDRQADTKAPPIAPPLPTFNSSPSQSHTAETVVRQPKGLSANTGKLANERDTLILPDLDVSEYLKDS